MSEYIVINSQIHGDNSLEVRFLENEKRAKSDAILLLFRGQDALQVTLIDGGLANHRTTDELLKLRQELLSSLSLPDEAQYQLGVRLCITHCHVDHITELYENIIPCELLAIESVYLPPITALPLDGTYRNDINGDFFRRSPLYTAIGHRDPSIPIITPAWGETGFLSCPCGELQFFAPAMDYGSPEGVELMLDIYGVKGDTDRPSPVRIVNSNCMMYRASCGGYSVLCPGDLLKVYPERTDESLNRMIAHHGEAIRSDIVKYPHHGIKRPAAAPLVAQHMLKEGGIVVLAAAGATEDGGAQLDLLGVPHISTEDGLIAFRLSDHGIERLA